MNLDVSPDGKEIVFDLLGDIFLLPIDGGEAKLLYRRHSLGHAAAFLAGRQGDLLHQRPRRRRQHLGDAQGRRRGQGGDQRKLPPAEQRGVEPGRPLPGGAQTLHRPPLARLGRDLALPQERQRRRAAQHQAQRAEGSRASRPSRPTANTSTSARIRPPAACSSTTRTRTTRSTPSRGSTCRTARSSGWSKGPAARSGRPRRRTANRWPSCAGCASRPRFSCATCRAAKTACSYDGLERDLQETWAIHGVYSNFGWTPDNKSLVFWAGGTLHKIDVKSSAISDIPFHVKKEMKVAPALHRHTEVAPAAFEAKMIRWPTVAPDGRKMVFQALGYLWLRDLPDGKPRRLTSQDERFEIFPSWSRDSRSIVYSTWSDAELGDLRVTSLVAPAGGSADQGDHQGSRPLRRAGLLAERRADRLPPRPGRLHHQRQLGHRARASTWSRRAAAAARKIVDHGVVAAFRRLERPGLLPRFRRRGQTLAEKRRAVRRGRRDPRLERGGDRFPGLAGRQMARLPGALPGLRDALHLRRQADRRRPQGLRPAGEAGLQNRRRLPRLVGRLEDPLLVARRPAASPQAGGGLRLPAGRAGEAARGGRTPGIKIGLAVKTRRAGQRRSPSPAAGSSP